MRALLLTLCNFKRSEHSIEEPGLLINEGTLIVDAKGEPVRGPIWSWKRRDHDFQLLLPLDTL